MKCYCIQNVSILVHSGYSGCKNSPVSCQPKKEAPRNPKDHEYRTPKRFKQTPIYMVRDLLSLQWGVGQSGCTPVWDSVCQTYISIYLFACIIFVGSHVEQDSNSCSDCSRGLLYLAKTNPFLCELTHVACLKWSQVYSYNLFQC